MGRHLLDCTACDTNVARDVIAFESLPSANALAAALVGRPVRTYLWRELRVAGVEKGAVVIEEEPGDERVRVGLDDLQAGLDRLEAEGEVAVTIDALGPWATEIAAMLVEAEGAAFADAPARVTYRER